MLAAPFYRDNAIPTYAREATILAFFDRIVGDVFACRITFHESTGKNIQDADNGRRPRLRHGSSACKLIWFGGADQIDGSVLSRLPMRKVPVISIPANWTFCCSVNPSVMNVDLLLD